VKKDGPFRSNRQKYLGADKGKSNQILREALTASGKKQKALLRSLWGTDGTGREKSAVAEKKRKRTVQEPCD